MTFLTSFILVFLKNPAYSEPSYLKAMQRIDAEISKSSVLEKENIIDNLSKISTSVLFLKNKLSQKYLRAMGIESTPQKLSNQFQRVSEKKEIQLYVRYSDPSFIGKLSQDILDAGGKIDIVSEPMSLIQFWLPYDKIEFIASKEYVKNITLPGYAYPKAGSKDSSADFISQADKVRLKGTTGKNIKVGVISTGIRDIAISQTSGDIPAKYDAKSARADNDLFTGWGGNNAEGLAMMEIVHDIAPDASLAFSNPNTSAEMIKAIQILDTEFNCDIIVDDLGFFDQAFFEDIEIANQAIATVNNKKLYISSAGNDAKVYYEGNFSGIEKTIGFTKGTYQNYDNKGDIFLPVTVPPLSDGSVFLQWGDKWGKSENDYDLYIFDSKFNQISKSEIRQDGQGNNDYPIEAADFTNGSTSLAKFYAAIKKVRGSDKWIKILCVGGSLTKYSSASGSIFGHPAAKEVLAVGAIDGAAPNAIEDFSSQGPVRIDFPNIEYRQKPDICGIDGMPVTGNGGFATTFYGTSASAPHVAGLAALLWSADKNLNADGIKNLLKNSTEDLGINGFDNVFGFGRANVYRSYEKMTLAGNTPPPAVVVTPEAAVLRIYPNPLEIGVSKTISFSGLKGNETIRIYTIDAELVIKNEPLAETWKWDLKNSSGNFISPGIYFYLITDSSEQKKIGKIAVGLP